MSRKNIFWIVLCVAALLAGTFGAATAGSEFTNEGNGRKGKYLYRKSCRSCHDGGSAAELSPNSQTQAQWQRTFAKYERLECAEEWKKLERDDLTDIYTYLYDHAYDSPQPATCE
ncbi:MAG: cytochrome c [Desulfohalobiaceae bacterium]|nr:cytochrome c [Desulfohalobiaceae bacterium]